MVSGSRKSSSDTPLVPMMESAEPGLLFSAFVHPELLTQGQVLGGQMRVETAGGS